MKIATHNSATGERSKNLLHALFTPFSKCQDKTIREQYDAGVRYFDLRVDKDLVLCHGLWKSNKTLTDILLDMRKYATERTYITVTIERKYKDGENEEICKKIRNIVNLHGKMVKLIYIARKKPSWTIIKDYMGENRVACIIGYLSVPSPKQYLTLPYKDWRRYIPIPRLLKKITPMKETDCFVLMDFV